MRVAIYARVSTEGKGQDTENQMKDLRGFAMASGWTVAVEYIDHATGKNGDREQFKAMFVAASRRKFDAVIVWALDRFTREGVAETFVRIRELLAHGVQFVSYTEAHFRTTGPAGELMIAIAAWIAEQERKRISDRTKAGLARVKAAGKVLGRREVLVDRAKVTELRSQGLGVRMIAEKMGLKRTVVHNALVSMGLAGGSQSANSSAPGEPAGVSQVANRDLEHAPPDGDESLASGAADQPRPVEGPSPNLSTVPPRHGGWQ